MLLFFVPLPFLQPLNTLFIVLQTVPLKFILKINFETFGWQIPQNQTVNGAIAYSSIKSYMQTNIEWSHLSKSGCQIQAGQAVLPNVQQY